MHVCVDEKDRVLQKHNKHECVCVCVSVVKVEAYVRHIHQ